MSSVIERQNAISGAGNASAGFVVGNPNVKEDWYVNPKTGEQIDFVYFARTEGRFAKQFDKEGKPSATPATFGVVTGAKTMRQLQVALKYNF